MAQLTLKSIEGERFPVFMAKRLSKALRGKRRWLGVAFPSAVSSREEANKVISEMMGESTGDSIVRLFDFHHAQSEQAALTTIHLHGENSTVENRSYGVLQVPHEAYNHVRTLIESEDALKMHSIMSLTSSGKIRLVRDRMALARPPRRR